MSSSHLVSDDLTQTEVVYREAFFRALEPDDRMLVSEWADERRILSAKAAAEPGPYRTSRTPFLREIMDTLSPYHPATEICFMKPAQVGGTESGNNWIGSVIDVTPAPFLMVQPTVELAKRWSKQRLAPMLADTPTLKNKVHESKSRDGSNTILMKEFEGGVLIAAGANSAAGLRSMPIRFLFMDEVDAYPPDADGEGDPTELARKRTNTFGSRKKIFENSTPTDKESSRIERRYDLSDQRHYYVPCPHCEEEQILSWSQVKWTEEGKSETPELIDVWYECEHCGGTIEEHHKTWMFENGRWIADYPERRNVGFHINGLYSPVGWKSWKECVEEFLVAKRKKDVSLLKVWVNTVLAETWEEEGKTVEHSALYRRREHYQHEVPEGVRVMTAGVDVQDDRLEYEIVGWGQGEESWSIHNDRLYGDPGKSELWARLSQHIIGRQWEHASGLRVSVGAACIDSGGHYTQQVYAYTKANQGYRVWATKGASVAGLPIASRPSKAGRDKALLFRVGTDTAKELIYSRLVVQEPGPGYCHWPINEHYDEEYFMQMTAEKATTKYVRGFPKTEWVKRRPRNEMLDCRVLSYAALLIWRPSLSKVVNFDVHRFQKENREQRPPRPVQRQEEESWFGSGGGFGDTDDWFGS